MPAILGDIGLLGEVLSMKAVTSLSVGIMARLGEHSKMSQLNTKAVFFVCLFATL